MKILIFSGTTEGRELSYILAERGHDITVSVATDYGSEEQGDDARIKLLTGAMPIDSILKLLPEYELCIDATHPYATHITASIKRACTETDTEYIRLLRCESELPSSVIRTANAAEAAEFLSNKDGNILLTTGAKELEAWRGIEPERLFPRILPSVKSIEACETLNIPHRNIIAMQGPFSTELNAAILKQYDITWLVTKDGGAPGGLPEKLAAANLCDVRVVVISRPADEGLSYEIVLGRLS